MLVLKRKSGESIIIGDNIKVTILEYQVDGVRVGIKAPREIPVHREEVYEAIRRENLAAVIGPGVIRALPEGLGPGTGNMPGG